MQMTEDTAILMFAAYALKIMNNCEQELAMNVSNMFKTHVESEVDSTLDYEFRLNRDLMLLNDTEEEGMLFEIPDRSNVEDDAKENVLKAWISREREVIKDIAVNL